MCIGSPRFLKQERRCKTIMMIRSLPKTRETDRLINECWLSFKESNMNLWKQERWEGDDDTLGHGIQQHCFNQEEYFHNACITYKHIDLKSLLQDIETEMGIFRQILRGKLDFDSEPWPGISDFAKDLIRKMLDRNPKTRLTAHEVLCHAWIVDDTTAPDKPLDSAVLSRLKQFSAMNKLKKMALRVIAERLSEEEIGGLKELFKMIDTDNSGTITFDELKEGLRRVGSDLMESEIKDLMNAADIDNNGTIDYGEFLAATVHLNKLERDENLVSAFSFFNKDGSGYITIDELHQACKEFGLSELHLDEMISEIDQDNDGQIDYGEFAAMMRKGNGGGGVGRRTMRKTINLGEALRLGVTGE